MDEIEQMGGLESQWVCHSHDLMGGSLHQDLYDRFGCPLHYHRVDRPRVRKKTKCEAVEFDGDGTRHGADFEALFLPTCTAGHSIYRWRSQGKYYLFTSHAIYQSDDQWSLQFNMKHREHWPAQLSALAKLRVDYLFPGYTAPDEDDFYRLDERSQKSLSKALRAKGKPLARPPEIVVPGPTAGIKLDCDFARPPWKDIPPMKFFARHGNAPQHKASARTAWDRDRLYFAFTNDEPEISKLKTLATQRDQADESAVWNDDTIEIFLCPDADDRARCYQFIVSAKGVMG